jgi:hypothetical protein
MAANRSARRARREPNHLHRTTERLEDLLAWSLGVLLVVAGWLALQAASSVYDTGTERARVQAEERTPVTAVVIEDSAPIVGANQSGAVNVPVRWIGRDGLEHTGRTVVEGIHSAGETVPAWEDRTGRVVPAPISTGDAMAAAVVVGVLSALAGAGLVSLTAFGLFRWTARRFARAWEQEWAQIGPEWSGRARS